MAFSSLIKTRMFVWIERCIAEGTPLPSDAAIVEAYNLASVEQARSLLSDLADAGRITVKGGYGPDRVISLGRAKPAPVVPAPRPEPAAKKVDPEVERTAEKIMAIVARSPTAAAVKARNAAELLKTVTPTSPPVRKPVHVQKKEPAVPAKTIQLPAAADTAIAAIEARVAEKGETFGVAAAFFIMRGIAEPAPVAAPVVPTFDDLLDMLRERFAEQEQQSVDAAIADSSARAEAAEQRAVAAERRLASLKELLA